MTTPLAHLPPDEVVPVLIDDPRLSDARPPLPHVHAPEAAAAYLAQAAADDAALQAIVDSAAALPATKTLANVLKRTRALLKAQAAG